MLKPKKQAFLKHDLYKVVVPESIVGKGFTAEEIDGAVKQVTFKKFASKGMRFVYCDTDRKDGRHGWYASDDPTKFSGFGKMTGVWAKENLTEPEEYEKKSFDRFY